jgi:hypothetical protein
MDTLHEDVHAFLCVYRRIFPGMKTVSNRSCREKLTTHSMSNTGHFFRKSYSIHTYISEHVRSAVNSGFANAPKGY